jgi:hypothetical protein
VIRLAFTQVDSHCLIEQFGAVFGSSTGKKVELRAES